MPQIVPTVVTSAYEYETFTSVHTIYSDSLGVFGLSSLACVLSSYTISCRGSTNVTVRITGSTLIVSGYYGDVFDQDEIDFRVARRNPAVTSIYNYNDVPAYYWKATKYFPDRRPTTSIVINIITNNGAINTTQIIKNNWDYKLARIRSFITTGDLDTDDIFVSSTPLSLPDLVGSLVWKTTSVATIVTSITTTAPPVVSYLIVAGGGSGGPSQFSLGGGGGGGAGGLLSGTATITSGNVYTFTVGAGGAAATASGTGPGNNGGNSTAFGLTALGGGGGGNGNNGGNSTGLVGGSGGGGGYRGYTTQSNGGAGTTGQGFAGSGVNATSASGGGGGGAGGAGSQNTGTGGGAGGLGGPGVTWIDGNVYAAGGQGGVVDVQADATPNTGNGGQGSYAAQATVAGASGVVIIRYSSVYADASVVTGTYSYTNTGGFKTYKFTTSGSIAFSTISKSVSVTVYGAAGGSGYTQGGQGGTTTWTGLMSPGVVLTLYVAGQGTNGPADIRSSGGGGGGSAVLANGTLIAVAGGGGGGGSGTGTNGGNGGGSTGDTGGNSSGIAAFGGVGGSQSGPGAGGSGDRYPGIAGSGTNGGAGTGFSVNANYPGGYGYGTGGRGLTDNSDGGSGGGGGGYFGGGGGGGSANGAGGGGGSGYFRNSSFANVTYSSGSLSNGGRIGNGQIVVTIDGISTAYNYTGSTQSIII